MWQDDNVLRQATSQIKAGACGPLTMIYENSLQEGKLSDDWKVPTVIPIFKKSNNSDAGNYHPKITYD